MPRVDKTRKSRLFLQAAAILCTIEAQVQIMSEGQRSMAAQATQPSTAPAEMSVSQLAQHNSERIARIEATLPHLATKADIEALKSDLTWRIILAMGAMTGFLTFVAPLLHTQPGAPGA